MTAEDSTAAAEEAKQALARFMKELHLNAAAPSLRELSQSGGNKLSPSGISEILTGTKLPGYERSLALAAVLVDRSRRPVDREQRDKVLNEVHELWLVAKRWKSQVDAEKRSARLLEEGLHQATQQARQAAEQADVILEEARAEAERLLLAAAGRAKEVVAEADGIRARAEEARAEAERLLRTAADSAKGFVAEAEGIQARAEEARAEAERLLRTAAGRVKEIVAEAEGIQARVGEARAEGERLLLAAAGRAKEVVAEADGIRARADDERERTGARVEPVAVDDSPSPAASAGAPVIATYTPPAWYTREPEAKGGS